MPGKTKTPKKPATKKAKKKKGPKKTNGRGRPTVSKKKLTKFLLLYSTTNKSWVTVCDEVGLSTTAVWSYLHKSPEFKVQYEAAREMKSHVFIEEILDIADDGTNDWETRHYKNGEEYEAVNQEVVRRSVLRVDARKWIASKFVPKMYADRLHTEHSGKIETSPRDIKNLDREELTKEIDRLEALRKIAKLATA